VVPLVQNPLRELGLIINGDGARVTGGSFNLWPRPARLMKYLLAAMCFWHRRAMLIGPWDYAASSSTTTLSSSQRQLLCSSVKG
jgi:hypothetical protein